MVERPESRFAEAEGKVMTQTLNPSGMAGTGARNDIHFSAGESTGDTAQVTEDLVSDRARLSDMTQALLTETGLSYRQQEAHTGVPAATVYRIVNGDACCANAIQRFAAFAVERTHSHSARAYWRALLDRLIATNRRPVAKPTDRAATPAAALSADGLFNDVLPRDIAALYSRLSRSDSRDAVVHLLRALYDTEKQARVQPAGRL